MYQETHTTRENTVSLAEHHQMFRNPELTFQVSSRRVIPDLDIMDYLKLFYMYIDVSQIVSVFGNPDIASGLYGGRTYKEKHSLTQRHIDSLEMHGISLSLTLTNHFFNKEAYQQSKSMLKKYHKSCNSVICTNDQLAECIRDDFPDYTLRASIIKNLNTPEKIDKAFELYDQVVLPMDKNNDEALLKSLPRKEDIILFGNASCAYRCPARTCYLGFSQKIQHLEHTMSCSRNSIDRLDSPSVYFDVKKLSGLGFTTFKLVPIVPDSIQTAIDHCLKKRSH